jgi:hypothetical protein
MKKEKSKQASKQPEYLDIYIYIDCFFVFDANSEITTIAELHFQ